MVTRTASAATPMTTTESGKTTATPMTTTESGKTTATPMTTPGKSNSSRQQYITRLPSSSLLSQSLTTEPNQEAPQYGSVDLVTIKLNPEHENDVVRLLSEHISDLPKNLSWFVAKSTEEESSWLVLETQLSAPRFPSTPTTESSIGEDTHQGAAKGTMDPTAKATDILSYPSASGAAHDVRIIRKSSRFIEAFRSSSPSGPNPLGDFLFEASRFTASPPEMSRSRMIVAPFSSHRKAPDPDSLNIRRSEHFESYLAVILETTKSKLGQTMSLIELYRTFESSLSASADAETGLVAIEVHQDLEPSANSCLFHVLYYFTDEDAPKAFRQCSVWRIWRQSVAPFLDGAPLLQFYQGVFDSRPELRAYHGVLVEKENEVSSLGGPDASSTHSGSEAQCELPQHQWSPTSGTLSPTSMVSRMKDAMSKRQAPHRADSVDLPSKPADGTAVVSFDLRLDPFTDYLRDRYSKYVSKKSSVLQLPVHGQTVDHSYSLIKTIHRHFGLWRHDHCYVYRDWIPNVREVYFMGEFNRWDRQSHPLRKEPIELYGEDVWSITLKDSVDDGIPLLSHKMKYKLHIVTQDNREIDRIPPSAFLVWRSVGEDGRELHDAALWNPPSSERYQMHCPSPSCPMAPKIYEAYVGFSSRESRFGTYNEFRTNVLPRIHRCGYDTLVLVGIPQHSMSSVGWQVTNFLAPTAEFGTPDEFKQLVDAAHALGLYVMMSIVHSHSSDSSAAGLNEIDGSDGGFFRVGARGTHPQWNSRLFDYAKPQVCRFLVSQLSHYMEEYRIDGFKFEGLTSMLYHHHGIGWDFRDYNDLGRYFSFESNDESATFLMLINDFLHSVALPTEQPNHAVLSIGCDYSRVPILAHPVAHGGLGFDFRMAPHIADEWVRQLCHTDDMQLDVLALVSSVEMRHPLLEKTVSATEALSNALRSRRRLKVAMFAWESLHTHAVGGVAPHVTELAAGLGRLGHEVHIFVRAVGSMAQHSVQYGVHYHECPFNLNSDFVQEVQNMCDSFIGHLNATEQFMGQMFDICHAHDWLAAKAIVQAKRQGHACIQTMHSTEFGRCGNNLYGGASKRISDIEREGCHISDRIICVSGVLADEVSYLFGVHREKIKVIYNGITACNFDGFEDAAPIKASYNVQPMEPMFLFVGRMTIQKGPDLLIEAVPFILKYRADVKFVIVGDGHMKQGLVARANQLGVGHACRFLGAKSGGELKSLFKACDAVVVPSRNEPFGIVVLEAWSAYKPVVATTCGGPRDFVSPNVDGHLVDPNASSIAWGCCEILKNFEHTRWMGERGRVKAAFSFSWDHIAKTTETVYYEQLNKHDSPDSEGGLGDCTLACRLMGSQMHEHMGVFDQNDAVARGLALHKMIRLLTFGLGGESYSNFMGNEFGNPDYIDLPRPGNNFSFHHSNRRFDLADDKLLKYKHLEFFDACMIRLDRHYKMLQSASQFVTVKNQEDKVIAFERGPCLFVFNFHPHQSFEGYQIGHSLGTDLVIVLDTDDVRFGGFQRLSTHFSVPFPTLEPFSGRRASIKLYIPNRTGMVLGPLSLNANKNLLADPVFSIADVDEFLAIL